ncbi:tryptophan synthase subunit alpha [Roseofilum casamattae]|uniref:Tryptophan synthase alpha chain n=1 Tax=Roseofilum casamattae BLCC-M143 TaxID=3022442 RepID=A0ABT7BUS1_9CYAN|nr:tryptophan synthase subunit alpha [Roseofilum casamattae]MDJ1182936.1 tryptophan synthase subunit alpha [Roseofilum casamattae BLCC-M143]
MTHAISQCFDRLRSQHAPALIPFITAGDPDLETTAKALQTLDRQGADIIELGVPYSDPLADGPTIQAAATRALERGTNLDSVLEMLGRVSPNLKAPVILFTYYNPILYRGIDRFLDEIVTAGASGLVVPDLPLEEAQCILEPAAARGIEVVLLVAPTSSTERIEAIAKQSQGFIYLVSVTGVTGARTQVATRVPDLIQQIRNVTDKPIGVGFGISQPDHARQVVNWGADAVIVGSAIVRRLAEEGVESIGQFCQGLKEAMS